MEIKKDYTPNFWARRIDPRTGIQGKAEGLVLHITEGSLQSTRSWFRNKASQVSAHYVVDTNGDVYQFVNEVDAAWSAGKVVRGTWSGLNEINPNLKLIAVEMVNFGMIPSWRQWTAWAKLCKDICSRYGWTIDEAHVVNHNEIRKDKVCPGAWASRFYLQILSKFV